MPDDQIVAIWIGVQYSLELAVVIVFLRTKYSSEIYLVWYTISLFFVVCLYPAVLAQRQNIELAAACASYEESCRSFIDFFTNLGNESELLLIVLVIAVVPQLLAYILSAISGSASAPKFIWWVERFVILSLAKMLAAIAGVSFTTPVAKLVVGKQVIFGDVARGLLFTTFSFGYVAVDAWLNQSLPALWNKYDQYLGSLKMIHRFAKRNAVEK